MNSIVVKLGMAMVILLFVVLLPLGYVVNQVFLTFYYQESLQALDRQSDKIVNIIVESQERGMANQVVIAMQMIDDGVAILNSHRQVVIERNVETNLQKLLNDQDWTQLIAGNRLIKEEGGGSGQLILMGKPINLNQQFHGAVVIMTGMDAIEHSASQIRNVLMLSGVGALLLALGFTILMVRKLSIPMLNMVDAAKAMAKGDLNVRVTVESHDEIGSLAQAINELASDLKRFEDSRKEFFVNISHELRTPLTYIQGYVGLLEGQSGNEEHIRIIKNETQRLKRLVDDLFDLSQLEEGKMALTLEWVDLPEVLQGALDSVHLRMREKNISLVVEEEETPLLLLDGYRMQQVLINLLDNAIRYTKEGTILVTTQKVDDEVHILIRDTGIGIPQQELPYIFERFHRVEKSRSRAFGGTGLGLAIVKKLVEHQGGTISVQSNVGQGTEFRISFPIGKEERDL
ncbi:ATP-binding protein [Ammoniphilus sp. YIM 78166]|uniref:sensor histidine kinase n=1 Tax=Ammoniphilus sp. YIM 78166 TaxID=1644106 RepID=UPI0014300213|nr:ATP-binding protein [Ammoniphilus sp. YIM 78166]